MKKLMRILRKAGFILFLVMTAFAVGLTGQFMPITRERYQDKKTLTEQVDKKRKDDD